MQYYNRWYIYLHNRLRITDADWTIAMEKPMILRRNRSELHNEEQPQHAPGKGNWQPPQDHQTGWKHQKYPPLGQAGLEYEGR